MGRSEIKWVCSLQWYHFLAFLPENLINCVEILSRVLGAREADAIMFH